MSITRFVVFELLAAAVLVGSLLGAVATRFGTGSFAPIFRAAPIVAAVVMVVLPILFFGHPRSPERTPTPPPPE